MLPAKGACAYARLDINFGVVDHRGIPLVAEVKREAGNIVGNDKLCFDNEFSVTSSGGVYSEVTLERDEDNYDDITK